MNNHTPPTPPPPPPPLVQLIITLHEGGKIAVSGPIDNLILCLDLLDQATAAIKAHARQAPQGPVVIPPPNLRLR